MQRTSRLLVQLTQLSHATQSPLTDHSHRLALPFHAHEHYKRWQGNAHMQTPVVPSGPDVPSYVRATHHLIRRMRRHALGTHDDEGTNHLMASLVQRFSALRLFLASLDQRLQHHSCSYLLPTLASALSRITGLGHCVAFSSLQSTCPSDLAGKATRFKSWGPVDYDELFSSLSHS